MPESRKKIKALHGEILADLKAHIDPSYQIADLVPTEGTLLGVRVPAIRQCVKDFKAQHKDFSVEDAVALLDHCAERQGREEMLFAMFLLEKFKKKLGREHWQRFDAWVDALENWETCDQLAKVASHLVNSDLSLIEDLVVWAGSENKWRRRFAIALSTSLNHGGKSHAEETFRILEPVLADPEAMIQKAVGWALREVSKQAPKATYAFLLEHQKVCPPRVLREGGRKLPGAMRARLLEN